MSEKINVDVVYYAVKPRDLSQEEIDEFCSPETQAALKRVAEACEKFADACRKVQLPQRVHDLKKLQPRY